jgi:hypothetical protein
MPRGRMLRAPIPARGKKMKIILYALLALSVFVGAYLFGDAITAELATCVTEGNDCPWNQDYTRCQRAGTTDLNGYGGADRLLSLPGNLRGPGDRCRP